MQAAVQSRVRRCLRRPRQDRARRCGLFSPDKIGRKWTTRSTLTRRRSADVRKPIPLPNLPPEGGGVFCSLRQCAIRSRRPEKLSLPQKLNADKQRGQAAHDEADAVAACGIEKSRISDRQCQRADLSE